MIFCINWDIRIEYIRQLLALDILILHDTVEYLYNVKKSLQNRYLYKNGKQVRWKYLCGVDFDDEKSFFMISKNSFVTLFIAYIFRQIVRLISKLQGKSPIIKTSLRKLPVFSFLMVHCRYLA